MHKRRWYDPKEVIHEIPVHEEFIHELLGIGEQAGDAVMVSLREDFSVLVSCCMRYELEHVRIPSLQMLQHHTGDAKGTFKPSIEEVDEDLSRRPEGAINSQSQIFLHTRAKINIL